MKFIKNYANIKIRQPDLTNIYDSVIGNGTSIGAFTEIGGARIGKDCKIQAHVFIPPGTEIGNNVFIGPGVRFCNVMKPDPYKGADQYHGVKVAEGAVIGAGSIILPGILIWTNAFIGAGSVVTKNCQPFGLYYGNPARYIRKVYQDKEGFIKDEVDGAEFIHEQ